MTRLRRSLLVSGPVVVWLVVIATTSGEAGAQSHIEDWAMSLLQKWFPDLASDGAVSGLTGVCLWALRKPAHLLEYGVLAVLIYRALGLVTKWRRRWLVAGAVLFCGVVGSIDELYQSLLPERTALASDVLIDMIGALLAVAICCVGARRRQRGQDARL